ncbi:hypothetical protein [Pseudomonas rhodesiae]|uniref:hypothetical protein n=1 Tax=Pseudomonas rhodesiae TaxID=76760 RepID=UPI0032B2CDBE
MRYVAWAVILFFAVSWTFGLLVAPQHRVKSTVVALIHWWISIAVVVFTGLSVYHLFWLMPLTLVVSMVALNMELRKFRANVGTIFLKVAVVIWPATFFTLKAAGM